MKKNFTFPRLGGILVMLSLLYSACAVPKPAPSNLEQTASKAPIKPTLPKVDVAPRFEATDMVVIKTSLGEMTVELYGKQAPKTIANFLHYVDQGYYTGKIFHRIIDGFMIQGGGFTADLERDETEDPIPLEIIPGLRHQPGVVSMARQPNDIHSATTQFFICTTSAPQLNGTYAAFGKLVSGEDVLRAISRVSTHTVDTEYGKMNDVPIQPVLIESITHQ